MAKIEIFENVKLVKSVERKDAVAIVLLYEHMWSVESLPPRMVFRGLLALLIVCIRFDLMVLSLSVKLVHFAYTVLLRIV